MLWRRVGFAAPHAGVRHTFPMPVEQPGIAALGLTLSVALGPQASMAVRRLLSDEVVMVTSPAAITPGLVMGCAPAVPTTLVAARSCCWHPAARGAANNK